MVPGTSSITQYARYIFNSTICQVQHQQHNGAILNNAISDFLIVSHNLARRSEGCHNGSTIMTIDIMRVHVAATSTRVEILHSSDPLILSFQVFLSVFLIPIHHLFSEGLSQDCLKATVTVKTFL